MNICVYGASSATLDGVYIAAGEQLGKHMAERGHALVFGGGASGLMGAAARGEHSAHGRVIGIAPTFFSADGVIYKDCDEFIPTTTMRERKQLLEEKSDAYIMAPGGIGTFDEFFEMLTLKQLGRHDKPMVVFNTAGYYDSLLAMIENGIEKEFIFPTVRELYFVTDSVDESLDYIEHYEAKGVDASHYKNV